MKNDEEHTCQRDAVVFFQKCSVFFRCVILCKIRANDQPTVFVVRTDCQRLVNYLLGIAQGERSCACRLRRNLLQIKKGHLRRRWFRPLDIPLELLLLFGAIKQRSVECFFHRFFVCIFNQL